MTQRSSAGSAGTPVGNWFVGFPVVAPALGAALGTPPPAVRPFHVEDLHATLAFFGPVSEEAAHAGWSAVTLALSPRAVVLGPVIALGNPRHPSALSASIDDPELTLAIGAARDAVLRAAGARLDDRPPLAHVTIARIARAARASQRHAAIAWAAALSLASIPARIDQVALYTWAPDRKERLFRIVASRPLG